MFNALLECPLYVVANISFFLNQGKSTVLHSQTGDINVKN